MGFGALALLLPEASEAHGGPQLPGLGLLATGHVEGLLKAGLRLCRWCCRVAASSSSPLSRYSSASQRRSSLSFATASASASSVRPSSTCPTCAYGLGQQGKIIRPTTSPPWPARRPCPDASVPSLLRFPVLPCSASAQPRKNRSPRCQELRKPLLASRALSLPRPAPGSVAPPGGSDGAGRQRTGRMPG